jgi:hypothetical protein
MTAVISISAMTAPMSPVFILTSTTSTEIRIPDGGVWLTPTSFSTDLVVTGLDDGLSDGPQAWTVVLSPADASDPSFLGSDPPDIQGTNLDNENGCDVRANQFCGGLPSVCCLQLPVDAGLGLCTGSCTAGVGSTGLAVSCMQSSQCGGEQCLVQGTTLACGTNVPEATRPTCSTAATCGGLSCADDPTFRVVKTCQCDPLLQQCTVLCDAVGRLCRSAPFTEEFMGSGQCPSASCIESTGCCHSVGVQSCANPGLCSGILVGCSKTSDCQPGRFCSWTRVTDGGLPTAARCIPGFDGRETCQLDAGSSATNCAGGGTCTGVWNQGAIAGELPGYCR